MDKLIIVQDNAQVASPSVLRNDVRWSLLHLAAFRVASSYLILSWLTVYGVLQILPWIGFRLEGWIESLWGLPVRWVGTHVVHLSGVAAQFHATDSRDTALSWISAGLIIPAAATVALIWSVLDRHRLNYIIFSEWLRYILRLALVFLMLRYALMKIFPLQMLPPSLAVLNEPLGNTSPMTLFWTAVGMHPRYEMLAGWIEAIAALLLLFRRTALLGTFLTIVIMTNVLIDNLVFDIPVILGAANLLVIAVAIAVPDLTSLWRLFLRREATSLTSHWAPQSSKRSMRMVLHVVELAVFIAALTQFVPADASAYHELRANQNHPSRLTGLWHVDSMIQRRNGIDVPMPVLTGLGEPMTDISFEPGGAVMARAKDGMLWRAYADINVGSHIVELGSGYFEGLRFDTAYSFSLSDSNHLSLVPTGDAYATQGTILLTRIPTPAHYPLLDRKFHWINEWALER